MKASDWAIEARDYKKIDKLNQLNNIDTFWNDCRKLTINIRSDRGIKRWQCLAEIRYEELVCGHELTPRELWDRASSKSSQNLFENDSDIVKKVDRPAQTYR